MVAVGLTALPWWRGRPRGLGAATGRHQFLGFFQEAGSLCHAWSPIKRGELLDFVQLSLSCCQSIHKQSLGFPVKLNGPTYSRLINISFLRRDVDIGNLRDLRRIVALVDNNFHAAHNSTSLLDAPLLSGYLIAPFKNRMQWRILGP